MTDKFSNVLKAKEDMQKSPEQLEKEKREILAQRVIKLNLDNKRKEDLVELVNQFHELLLNIHCQIYDLNEKHDRQKYDMMELAERAKQIEKGKAKTRKSNIVHTGLGGGVFEKLAEQFPSAPQKISLFSRYERVTDRRTFKDRRELWATRKEKNEFIPVRPKAKIKQIEDEEEEPVVRRKQKSVSAQPEERHEEEHQEEEQQHEEEHHEEEQQQEENHEEEQNEEEQEE